MEPKTPAPEAPATVSAAPVPSKPGTRRILLMVLGVVTIIGLLVAGVYWVHAQHYESTDDATLEGHVIAIGAQVSARVATVNVVDNQLVNKGDVLVELDPTDYQAAVTQAQGSLSAMRGKFREAQAQVPATRAQSDEAKAEVDAAQTNFDNLDTDLKRYESLDERARSKQQYDTAKSAQKSAWAQVEQAKAKLVSSESQIATAEAAVLAAQGDVEKAQADLLRAQINLGYCKIEAPESGRVTRKAIEPGAYVAVGQALLAVVPPEVWVVANFKETQLTYMRPGQAVSIRIDAYPDREFTGKVESVQSGTGARFSMLPAENATGNFVKIVQRLPVKILLDPDQSGIADVFLAPGMSVEAQVTVK